jgi:N-acetylmuramic acid 6-phosphate etherase
VRRSAKGQRSGTEQLHPLAEDLDLVPAREVVERLHREDLRAVTAVGLVLPEVTRASELAAQALSKGGRILYVGAGTSGRLGLLDAVECPPTFGTDPKQVQAVLAGGPRALRRAVEGAEDDARSGRHEMKRLRVSARDCVIGITASATTPFVHGALVEARRRKARTVLVCCNQAPPSNVAQVVVAPLTGPEVLAGSTRLKAGTATKLVLNAISTTAMIQLGKVYRGRMIDVRPTNQKLKARAALMVSELGEVSLARASALLRQANGSPRIALLLAWQGGTAAQARRLASRSPLRALAPRPT